MTNDPTIALDVLLGIDYHGMRETDLDGDLTPWQCVDCPFGTLDQPYEQVMNDVSEAYYQCSLLGERVWGESAPCKPEDWRKKARDEINRTLEGDDDD